MGWKTKTALSLLALIAINYGYGYYRWHTGPTCDEVRYEESIAAVSIDLLENRIPEWEELQPDKLGTDKPDISFNKSKSFESDDVRTISVTITGPLKTHRYFAMYICRLGGVEYSADTSI